MKTQIAVRLPDDLVGYIDELVAAGIAPSRAAVITAALERSRRRNQQERDAEIYATRGEDPDLTGFTRHAATQPMGID